MIPRAYDSSGTPLTVSSSHQLDGEGIRLGWEGEGEECYHKVMLWAVDGQGQEVACEIKVVLQGKVRWKHYEAMPIQYTEIFQL